MQSMLQRLIGENVDLVVVPAKHVGAESRSSPRLRYTDDAVLRHGVLDDVTHFIGKPYTAAELTRKVREVLDA